MLMETLRALEHDGIVESTVYPVIPPHVEYALTPLGRTLPLDALCRWAEEHLDEVERPRDLYAQRSGSGM